MTEKLMVKQKQKIKQERLQEEEGIHTKGTAKELVKLAEDNGINTTITITKIV